MIGNVHFVGRAGSASLPPFTKPTQAQRINTTINKYRARIMNGDLVYVAVESMEILTIMTLLGVVIDRN